MVAGSNKMYKFLMINFSAASDQIFMILGLLELSHQEESESKISFTIFFFQIGLNKKLLLKFNLIIKYVIN